MSQGHLVYIALYPIPIAMSLSEVVISNDVWQVCVAHALTTEKEEVMGLLLGEIEVWSEWRHAKLIIVTDGRESLSCYDHWSVSAHSFG